MWLRPEHGAVQSLPCLNAFAAEPPLVHFQHKAHRLAGAVGLLIQRLHVREVGDAAIVSDKGCGQGQGGVFHPEALDARAFENKQHAFVLGHGLALHQTDLTFWWPTGYLGVNAVHARTQLGPRQIELGDRLCAA